MLKPVCLLALLLLTGMTDHACAQQAVLEVEVTRLRNDKGQVLLSLFRSEEGFPEAAGKAFRTERILIRDRKAGILLGDLPAGLYAIAILHDENADGRMNKNGLGLPREGYGFSNNVTAAFGPPSFQRASFRCEPGHRHRQTIRLRY